MKYKEWLAEWLECYVRPSKKPSTYTRYESAIRLHIRPKLGETDLAELSGLLLQKTMIELFEKGHYYKSAGLAATTICQIAGIVQSSLRQAVKVGLIENQYANEIALPKSKNEAREIKCFTEREQKKIEVAIISKQDKRLYGILISLYMGLRIGELLSLTWDNVDFKKEILTVSKTCRDEWGGGYRKIEGAPKTSSSDRAIPIPKQLLPYFRMLKKQSSSKYVITGKGGEISVRSYQRTFERFLHCLKIRHLGFHALRHTFATRAIENNVDIKTLSEIMGHKSPAVTLAIYAHSLAPHKRCMMNKLGKLLTGTVKYAVDEE